MDKKSHKNVQSSLVDLTFSFSASVFTKVGGLDDAFTKVDPSSYYGVLSPTEDEQICNKYGDCVIPIYKSTISVLGRHLPFTAFEIKV